MPVYDYICGTCGRRTEFIHGVHAPGPEACPSCGGGPMKKAVHAPAVHYRGSGWAKKERASSGVKPARDSGAPAEATAGEARSGEAGDGGGTAAATVSGSGDSGDSGRSGGSEDSGSADRAASSKDSGRSSGSTGSERGSKPASTGAAEA